MKNPNQKQNSDAWVIRLCVPSPYEGETWKITSFWCGPDRSWGMSFGPLLDEANKTLSMAVAVFVSKADALEALSLISNYPLIYFCHPVQLAIAIDELIEQI